MKKITILTLFTLQSLQALHLSDYGSPDAFAEEKLYKPATAIVSSEPYNPALHILEEANSDFIIDHKQIQIPGYPHAFNPSIVKWNDKWLMSFRIYHPQTGFPNQIGLVYLDETFTPRQEPQVLQMPLDEPLFLFKRQDPRLVIVGDHLFIVYNNQLKYVVDRELRRMLVAEVKEASGCFYTGEATSLLEFEGANTIRTQKNWVPFAYQNELLLAYSLSPHRIFQVKAPSSECPTIALSETPSCWDWGHLRGGTPALKIGDSYLGFFHSSMNLPSFESHGKVMLHYFFGAYLFDAKPPFKIQKISKDPIIGKDFYNGPEYPTWKPLRVVFPGGFVFNDKFIWVVYGKQDHECWVVKLDRKKLLDSLIPVGG